jgi:uncharacterized protein (TIGR00266 family)
VQFVELSWLVEDQRNKAGPERDNAQAELLRDAIAEIGRSQLWDRQPSAGNHQGCALEVSAIRGDCKSFSDGGYGGLGNNFDSSVVTFFAEHRENLTRRFVTKQLAFLFFVPADAVAFDELKKVFGAIACQSGFREGGIAGNKVFRRRIQVRKVAAAAAGDSDFFSDLRVAFEHDDGSAAFAGFDGAHQAGCAGADYNHIRCLHRQASYRNPEPLKETPMAAMHEIDYQIHGDDMQFVEVELDPGEATVAEAGGMMYMEDGIEMETIFGDGSQQQRGVLGALMGAGKRLLTGESLFMTVFLNRANGKRKLAFGAPYPGKIVAIHLAEIGGELIAQKDSFLAAAKGVSIGIAFQRKLGVGLFGGEGFIMQRLQGDGWAFVHAGGMLMQRELQAGETLRIDTGCIVAFQPTVAYDIQYVGRIKSALFGGEGLFFATLRGPGRVWLQSLPLSRLANRIVAAVPGIRGGREEGSVLGPIGDILSGDRS